MAGTGSPPRYRHDGTSPLPLGMDASSPPLRWNGVGTVWPHDFRSGWSYCVMVPNWLTIPQATTAEGNSINPTVFYRVQVGIQSPQGISTVHGILRRFSDFLKLFAALKKAFPNKKLPAAPPKNSLMRINSSQASLQERRRAIEDWMGKLLADIQISRSVPIASFLELEAAARYAVNTISDQQASSTVGAGLGTEYSSSLSVPTSSSGVRLWTGAGAGSSVASSGFASGLDFRSDASDDTSSVVRTLSRTSNGLVELEMEALALEHETAINKANEGASVSVQHRPGGQAIIRLASTDAAAAAAEADERSSAGHVTDVERGDKRSHPGEGAIAVHQANTPTAIPIPRLQLQHALSSDSVASWHRRKGSHESIISDVESVRGSEPSVAPSLDGNMESSGWEDRLVEADSLLKGGAVSLPLEQRSKVRRVLLMMQRKLSGAKADIDDLNARLNQETLVKEFLSIKVRDLEGDLDNTRRKSREVLQQAVSTERDRVTSLQWELEECKNTVMNLEESSWSEKEARQSLEEKVKSTEATKEEKDQEVADLKERIMQLQRERDLIEAQARADKKVLAKEIKALRGAQPEIRRELEIAKQAKVDLERILQEENQKQENARALRAKFLHEVGTLRQRLQECTVDFLAREEEKSITKSASGVTDALDLLSTSDNRIGLLLAEAQLLAQQSRENVSANNSQVPNGVHSNGAVMAQHDKLQQQQESNGDAPDSETALHQILTDLIIDNAQLRRAINHSLTQSALTSQRGGDKDSAEDASHLRNSVLANFFFNQKGPLASK